MSLPGGSLEATRHKVRRDYAGIQLNGWKVRSVQFHIHLHVILRRAGVKERMSTSQTTTTIMSLQFTDGPSNKMKLVH